MVMIRRAPALISVLYVAHMRRTNDTAFIPVAIGTVVWIIAGIVLVLIGSIDRVWIASCAVGALAGAGGLVYLTRRARRPGVGYE